MQARKLFLVGLIVLLTSAYPQSAQADLGPEPDLPAWKQSVAKIEAAKASGRITIDEAAILRLWALSDPARLPAEFAPTAAEETPDEPASLRGAPARDGLAEMAEMVGALFIDQDKWSSETARQVKLTLQQGAMRDRALLDDLTLERVTDHFVIHWTDTGPDAPPTGEAYIITTADSLEYAWTELSGGEYGYVVPDPLEYDRPPHPSDDVPRFDVYVQDEFRPCGLNLEEPLLPGDPPAGLSLPGELRLKNTVGATRLQTLTVHEWFHMVQWDRAGFRDSSCPGWLNAYRWYLLQGGWLMESTASWVEDELYPADDEYLGFYREFIARPEESLFSYRVAHQYGAAVFIKYLQEHVAKRDLGYDRKRDIVRDIWERVPLEGNDPVGAVTYVLMHPPSGASPYADADEAWRKVYEDFAVKNLLREYADGGKWKFPEDLIIENQTKPVAAPQIPTRRTSNLSEEPAARYEEAVPDDLNLPLGDDSTGATLELEFLTGCRSCTLDVVQYGGGGQPTPTTYQFQQIGTRVGISEAVSSDFGKPGGTDRVVVVFVRGVPDEASSGAFEFTFTAIDNPPIAPRGLTATASAAASRIELGWQPIEEDRISYRLYRSTESPVERSTENMLAEVTGTSYADASAEPGTTYHYVLTAVDAGGNEGPPSNEASARLPVPTPTPTPTPPPTPPAVVLLYPAGYDFVPDTDRFFGFPTVDKNTGITGGGYFDTEFTIAAGSPGSNYAEFMVQVFCERYGQPLDCMTTGVWLEFGTSGGGTPPLRTQNLSVCTRLSGTNSNGTWRCRLTGGDRVWKAGKPYIKLGMGCGGCTAGHLTIERIEIGNWPYTQPPSSTLTPTPTSTPSPTATPVPTPRPCTCTLLCVLRDILGIAQAADSTCTSCASGVLAKLALQAAEVWDGVELLQQVRDRILVLSPEGQRYVDLYVDTSPEIAEILIADAGLRTEGFATIDLFRPGFQALLDDRGDEIIISPEQVNAVEQFLGHLSSAASPELSQIIAEEREADPLGQLTGKTMDDALSVLLDNQPPSAEAGSGYVVLEGDWIELHGSATDPEGDPVTLEWDFTGEGRYAAAGEVVPFSARGLDGPSVQVVSLYACDDKGRCTADQASIEVRNTEPVVAAGDDIQADEGSPVTFEGVFVDFGIPDSHAVSWDFGDGSGALDTLTPVHAYLDNGTYPVVLSVADDDGGVGSGSLAITVNNVVPTVVVEGDEIDEGGLASITLAFSDTGADDTHGGTVVWGDGSPPEGLQVIESQGSGSATAEHIFSQDGPYTGEACILDDDGGEACASFSVIVGNLPPIVQPHADIEVEEGMLISTALAAFQDPGSEDTHSATVEWGDGAVDAGKIDELTGVVSGSHTFAAPGSYTINVAVCDDAEACASATLAAQVRLKPTETPTPPPTETPTPPPSPADGIVAIKVAIRDYIAKGEIDPKAEQSMMSKLDAALQSLEKENPQSAGNQLGAFINHVRAQRGKKISELAADDLIAQAEAVIGQIERTSAGR